MHRRRRGTQRSGVDVVRGRCRTVGRLDGPRATGGQPGQRQRLDGRPPICRRHRPATTSTAALRPRAGDHPLPAGYLGPYPFGQAGGIVDDDAGHRLRPREPDPPHLRAGLLLQPGRRRPPSSSHELAHQWYGDSLALDRWHDIWLNEGFATYAEWLWSEHEGSDTAQEIFDFYAAVIPADDPFWTVTIGDPGPDHIFDGPVYDRGAMTLHALRTGRRRQLLPSPEAVGRTQSGGNVTTAEFQPWPSGSPDRTSTHLFRTWLYTPEKPAGLDPAQARARAAGSTPSWARQPSHAPRR